MTSLASGWRDAGFDFTEFVVPAAQTQDNQVKSSYPGILMSATAGREGAFNSMGIHNVSRRENQWRGSAWNGYSNPELDRLIVSSMQPSNRPTGLGSPGEIVELLRDRTPRLFSCSFRNAFGVYLRLEGDPDLPAPGWSSPAWNIHEWELH